MEKVSVALSIYKPNIDFLTKQLKSINNQTYKNIEVLIRDDCPTDKCNKDIFKKYLTKVNYKILPYKRKNLGFVKSFEELVKAVKHNGYIIFCDQDDVWLPNRVEITVKEMEKSGKKLSVCDRMVIDENDNIIKKSVMKSSPSFNEYWNNNDKIDVITTPFHSYSLGMCITVKADFAKKSIPYYYGHDRQLFAYAVAEDSYMRIPKVLVKYRKHSKNVSGFINNVNSKKDYYNNKVLPETELAEAFIKKYPNIDGIDKIKEYNDARLNNKIFKILKYRYISPKWSVFQAAIIPMPNFIFRIVLKILRKKYKF